MLWICFQSALYYLEIQFLYNKKSIDKISLHGMNLDEMH